MELTCGNHTYLWQGDWAKLPGGVKLGYTHGVVEDRRGNIYIANQSKDAIVVFDAAGNLMKSWGEEYASGAHGLTLANENGAEFLYLANTSQAEVVKTKLDGTVVWKMGVPARGDIYGGDKKFCPTETAVGLDGRVYVADGYGQPWVHICTAEGKYVSSFGGAGEAAGKLREPHGVSIDARGTTAYVQVTNRANRRIDNFTLEGEFVGTAIGSSELRYPCTTVHQGKDLYVPDLFCRLSIFDQDNVLVGHLGDYIEGAELTSWGQFKTGEFADLAGYPNLPHEKRKVGKFSSPHGMHVDPAGNIYVVEWIEDGRVTRLQRMR